jgi:tRNA threonylcarbamoyladenosine biosynthesis protein TsaE
VIVLSGPLGAGKTRFVAGLARGLDAPRAGAQPSFTLINEYRGDGRCSTRSLPARAARGERLGLEEQLERGAGRRSGARSCRRAARRRAHAALEIAVGDPRARSARARGRGARLALLSRGARWPPPRGAR